MVCSSDYEMKNAGCVRKSSSFPWWGILLIVVGGLVLIAVVGTFQIM